VKAVDPVEMRAQNAADRLSDGAMRLFRRMEAGTVNKRQAKRGRPSIRNRGLRRGRGAGVGLGGDGPVGRDDVALPPAPFVGGAGASDDLPGGEASDSTDSGGAISDDKEYIPPLLLHVAGVVPEDEEISPPEVAAALKDWGAARAAHEDTASASTLGHLSDPRLAHIRLDLAANPNTIRVFLMEDGRERQIGALAYQVSAGDVMPHSCQIQCKRRASVVRYSSSLQQSDTA
jgi:hypothetical protein